MDGVCFASINCQEANNHSLKASRTTGVCIIMEGLRLPNDTIKMRFVTIYIIYSAIYLIKNVSRWFILFLFPKKNEYIWVWKERYIPGLQTQFMIPSLNI